MAETTPTCGACKEPIVLPHCQSPTCNWCRGCYERKVEEGKR